jgi:hypothetical protein
MLHRIRSIRRSVSSSVLKTLVVSLVLPQMDYGSAILADLPRQLFDGLQPVVIAAARLVISAWKYDHII